MEDFKCSEFGCYLPASKENRFTLGKHEAFFCDKCFPQFMARYKAGKFVDRTRPYVVVFVGVFALVFVSSGNAFNAFLVAAGLGWLTFISIPAILVYFGFFK